MHVRVTTHTDIKLRGMMGRGCNGDYRDAGMPGAIGAGVTWLIDDFKFAKG